MRSSKSRSRNKNRNRPQGGGNIVNRVFDSSGPESKVRGTPAQIIEKYNQLARDAQLSNDRVAFENFQQHSEHYTRMLAAAQKEMDARQPQGGQQGYQQNGGGIGGQGERQDDRRGDASDRTDHGVGRNDQYGRNDQSGGRSEQSGGRNDQSGGRGEQSGGRGEQGDGRGDQSAAREPQGGPGGRRGGNRRRDRSEGEGHDAGQGGTTEVIDASGGEPDLVVTPEIENAAPPPDKPKRGRPRKKAPAPADGDQPRAAEIDGSAV